MSDLKKTKTSIPVSTSEYFSADLKWQQFVDVELFLLLFKENSLKDEEFVAPRQFLTEHF